MKRNCAPYQGKDFVRRNKQTKPKPLQAKNKKKAGKRTKVSAVALKGKKKASKDLMQQSKIHVETDSMCFPPYSNIFVRRKTSRKNSFFIKTVKIAMVLCKNRQKSEKYSLNE